MLKYNLNLLNLFITFSKSTLRENVSSDNRILSRRAACCCILSPDFSRPLIFRLFLFLHSLIFLTHSLEINPEHEIDFAPIKKKKKKLNTNEHIFVSRLC